MPGHLKLAGGGGGGELVPKNASAAKTKSPARRPKRRRIHDTTSPPPSSGEQAAPPTQLRVGGSFFASQVQSSVSSTIGYRPEASAEEDDFRSAAKANFAAGDAGAADAAGVKPPSGPSTSRAGSQGLSGSVKRSPERQTTGGDDDLGFSGGGGGDSVGVGRGVAGGTWSNETAGGMVFPEQNAPVSPRAGQDCRSAAGWESAWDTERESRGLTGDAGSRFPGSAARLDMPSGLKECVERLCAAAFLRGHVPEGLMPKDTTPGEAYQRWGAKSHTPDGRSPRWRIGWRGGAERGLA